jgi:hypothetical protein
VYIGESSLDDFSAQVLTHNTFTYYSSVEQTVKCKGKYIKKIFLKDSGRGFHGNDRMRY